MGSERPLMGSEKPPMWCEGSKKRDVCTESPHMCSTRASSPSGPLPKKEICVEEMGKMRGKYYDVVT